MTATINASTSSGVIVTSDTSGALALQTANTTAMTINSSQVVNFANTPTIAGSAFPSGAMTLISTQTATASTQVAWTGLTGYNDYLLIFRAFFAGYNAPKIQVGTGSGPTWITSGYNSINTISNGSSVYAVNANNGTGGDFLNDVFADQDNGLNWINNMNCLGSNLPWTTAVAQNFVFSSTSTQFFDSIGASVPTNTTVKTAIRAYSNGSANISGVFSLYGISS